MKTKLFTLFLALVSSVGIISAESGTCGQNLTWNLSNGVLTISGTGAMYDYDSNSPWYNQRESITSIIINNGVTSIGDVSFASCTYLTSVNIPNSVTSIGNCAFSSCQSLTSVVIPNSVQSIGWGAFNACYSLTFINISNNITSIEHRTFSYCSSLTSVSIPNSVTNIEENAFFNCSGLTSINIPTSVSSIGATAFCGCYGLISVTAPASIFEAEEYNWTGYTRSLQSVTFTSGELTYNVLGVLARSNKTLNYLNIAAVNNTELEDEAFKGFYNLQTLILPSDLTTIGYMAVADCKNLQSINIPASVTEISQSAFENCRSLQSITFGESTNPASGRHNMLASSNSQLQTIGNWAFYNCHELQNLEIPEGVTYIGDGAFYGCVYMEDLVLPASIQSIGDNTFALCSKLQKIIVNAPVPPSIQAKTFFDVKRQIPVYVPDESVMAYENDAQWSEFNIQGVSHMPLGLEDVNTSTTIHKLLHNGQILILRGDKTYTLTGQEIIVP